MQTVTRPDRGYQPRWRGDGKELFYISPSGQLMSVDITPGIDSAPGRPAILFRRQYSAAVRR